MDERRKFPRYLCSDDFGDSTITIGNMSIQFVSTNFNRTGLAIFGDQRLPETESCQVSFSFTHDEGTIHINNLNCKIKHRHETEIGHSYGLKFDIEQESTNEQNNLLIIIEEFLAAASDLSDRYGLE